MFLNAEHRSNYVGTKALLSSLPRAKVLIADRGYDADWLRRWSMVGEGSVGEDK